MSQLTKEQYKQLLQLRKSEEAMFYELVKQGQITGDRRPRDIIESLPINNKRAHYLLEKWSDKGLYDYGVAIDLGWLEHYPPVVTPATSSWSWVGVPSFSQAAYKLAQGHPIRSIDTESGAIDVFENFKELSRLGYYELDKDWEYLTSEEE